VNGFVLGPRFLPYPQDLDGIIFAGRHDPGILLFAVESGSSLAIRQVRCTGARTMSQASMDSQKAPKEMGTCSVCWSTFRIQRATGSIHKHGPRRNPCPGSDKPPSTVQTSQLLAPSQNSATATSIANATASTTSSQTSQTATEVDGALSHPKWKTLISRIPRAARPACRELLTQILRRIVDAPKDKSAWMELLHFGPIILAKPKRGGANRNLSNILNKRTAAWDREVKTADATQQTSNRTNRKMTVSSKLAAAVTSKLEAGNFKAAIRIICSDDAPAPDTSETLKALEAKHPGPAADRRTPCAPGDKDRFLPIQVSSDEVQRALRSFPNGSSGGPDGLTPRHIIDLLTGATDNSLEVALVDWVNLMLAGSFDQEVNEIIFGGRLIALTKKDGGIRPITVGYTLRRLAAKCANNHVIERRSMEFRPLQLGAGVSGGAEAAVHATRRLVQNLPSDHVIVKLDFSNAFNCVRRDTILEAVAAKTPEIYRLVHAAYSCEPILVYGDHLLRSMEGAQQGDPLGSLEFCEAIHPLLVSLRSSVKIGFMDDVTLVGDISTVEADVNTILDHSAETGLQLNLGKCEIVTDNPEIIPDSSVLSHFVKVKKQDMTLLGAPVLKGPAQDAALRHKIEQLEKALQRLSLIHSHDALVLLKNSLSMPKLLYLLRTADCSDNPLLATFDCTLRLGLSTILNVDLSDTQWLQASLPVRHGGLGIRSAKMLAPSAFLASAASTQELQQSILPEPVRSLDDAATSGAEAVWTSLSGSDKPATESLHIQRAWDRPVAEHHEAMIWSQATTDVDKARLRAASSPHSGDWLAAPPITSVGLRLSDEEVRIAVAHRLGCRACEPHKCVCGKLVDARGLHGLACRRSAPRQQRHCHMNDIIWRAMKRAQIHAVKEPVGLMRQDGKRPDGTTILPWSRGKPLAWDVTVPDTYADAHVANSARQAGAAATQAATNKTSKYSQLASTHIFYPVAIETAGTWHNQAVELIQEIGRRATVITGDPKETMYLFQQLSVALQRGNAVSFQSTFATS